MRQIKAIFRLIRFPNLLIITLAMYLMRMMLIEPLLIMSHQAPTISSTYFFLIVLSAIIIAAAGYVINDIEDIKIDQHNSRENVILMQLISKDAAYNFYLALTFIGVCLGFYLTFKGGIQYIAYINLISAGLLYFYSVTYKRQFLIGNIVVAFLTSLSLALVYLTEPYGQKIESLKLLCSGYIAFAFLLSMSREIIKDMEDVEGDKTAGCKTLPIVAGLITGKIVASLFLFVLLSLLIVIQIISHQWESMIPFLYVAIFIEIPIILLLVSIFIANSKPDFKRSSLLAKFIMVTGIISIPVFFYSL